MHFRLTTIGRYKNRKSRVTLQLTIAPRQRALRPFSEIQIEAPRKRRASVGANSVYNNPRRSVSILSKKRAKLRKVHSSSRDISGQNCATITVGSLN